MCCHKFECAGHFWNRMLLTLIAQLPLFCACYFVSILPVCFGGVFDRGMVFFAKLVFPQAFIFAIIVSLFGGRKRCIWWFFVAVLTFFVMAETFTFMTQGCRITSSVLIIVLQSNPAEATEFITGSGQNIRGSIFALIAGFIFLDIVVNSDRQWKLSGVKDAVERYFACSKKTSNASCLIILILAIYSCACIYRVLDRHYHHWWQRVQYNYCVVAPISYYTAVEDAIKEASSTDIDRLQIANSNIKVNGVYHDDDLHIVFVIGESHIKHRTSTYGYDKPTYPYIDSLVAKGEIILFDNVISFSQSTRTEFPKLISTYLVGMPDMDFNDSPLLPAVMKKAGYTVGFFSTQSVVGASSGFDFDCYYVLSRKSIVDSAFDTFNTELVQYDDETISHFPPLQSNGSRLTIYHLFGQHMDVNERMPQWWERTFLPVNYKDLKQFNPEQNKLMADYDNACRFNDFTLNMIIEKISNQNAVLIYVPDHGDECFDWRNQRGRILEDFQPGNVKTVYELPLFIWTSPEYMARHPETIDSLRSNVDKPIYNSDISHTIMELAGVSSPHLRREASLLHSEVHPTRHNRLIGWPLMVSYDSMKQEIDRVHLIYEPGQTEGE